MIIIKLQGGCIVWENLFINVSPPHIYELKKWVFQENSKLINTKRDIQCGYFKGLIKYIYMGGVDLDKKIHGTGGTRSWKNRRCIICRKWCSG